MDVLGLFDSSGHIEKGLTREQHLTPGKTDPICQMSPPGTEVGREADEDLAPGFDNSFNLFQHSCWVSQVLEGVSRDR